jgi:hypothetical protein
MLRSIAEDSSSENIIRQSQRLTTDERRHLRALMNLVEHTIIDTEYKELFGGDGNDYRS